MPPALDRNNLETQAGAPFVSAFDQDEAGNRKQQRQGRLLKDQDDLLLMDCGLEYKDGGAINDGKKHGEKNNAGNILMNVDDYENYEDENLLNDDLDDYGNNNCFPPEFGQIEDKFQKSQLVTRSGPMVVEEDAEKEEDEEEKKVANGKMARATR